MSNKVQVSVTAAFYEGESLPDGLADPAMRLGVLVNQRVVPEQSFDVVHWQPELMTRPQLVISTLVSQRQGWHLFLPGSIEQGEAFDRDKLGEWLMSQPFYEKLRQLNTGNRQLVAHLLLPKNHACASPFVYWVGAYFL